MTCGITDVEELRACQRRCPSPERGFEEQSQLVTVGIGVKKESDVFVISARS